MQVFRDPRMPPQKHLLTERSNMIRMPGATTMTIITEKVTNAVITMAKNMSAGIAKVKDMIAAIMRVMRGAAVITASKPL